MVLENFSIKIWPLICQRRRNWGRLPLEDFQDFFAAWQKIHWTFCVYEETSQCREKLKKLLWEILEIFYHLLYSYHGKSLFTCRLLTKWKISLLLISGLCWQLHTQVIMSTLSGHRFRRLANSSNRSSPAAVNTSWIGVPGWCLNWM